MPTYKGTGGVEWEITPPAEGTMRRERFDEQLASGALVLVDESRKAPAAKKAAPVADTTEA